VIRALLLAVLAFALGVLGGWGSRRILAAASLPPPRRRPPLVRDALEAYERGESARLRAALREAEALEGLGPEDRAELVLLAALAESDLRGLLRLVRDAPDTGAGRRAAWEAIRRTRDQDLRRRREEDFRAKHPQAWVLRERGAR